MPTNQKNRACDKDIVKLARRLDKLNDKIVEVVREIEESGHPKAKEIVKYIQEELNVPVPAFFPIEIHGLLEHPDKWDRNKDDTDLVRKKAPKGKK